MEMLFCTELALQLFSTLQPLGLKSLLWFVFLQDKYKRALADAENVRQRSQKLVEEAKLYGQWRLFVFNLKTQEY